MERDSILWGRWEVNEECEECEECEDRENEQNTPKKKKAEEGKKNRNPPTSNKQLRKLGEPCRKMCRVEKESVLDENEIQVVNSKPRPKPGEEGAPATKIKESGNTRPGVDGPPMRKPTSPVVQNGNKRQAARIRKEEYNTKRELKAKMRKEKATLKEKKRKEQEDTLRKKGERRTINQPKILEWFRRKEGGQPI